MASFTCIPLVNPNRFTFVPLLYAYHFLPQLASRPRRQSTEPTLEALAASEEAADAQEAADTSCGVLEEGQAHEDEAFLGEEGGAAGERAESKNSVDL